MKTESTDIEPPLLTSHQMDVSGQLHAPAALPLGKELPIPVDEETW
jgi:hypothetical protein